MPISELIKHTYDLQTVKILSHFDSVLYNGDAEDLPHKFKPIIFDFFTAEKDTLTIYL